MRPLIGISGSRSVHAPPDYPPNLAHLRTDSFGVEYSSAVSTAGGLPVLLTREADPRELVDRVDGILIAGGIDVDPRRYGAAPGLRSTMLDPGRDEFEIAMVHRAVQVGRPLLGICRGHQLINVALGGTLIADLPSGDGESHSFLGYPPSHRSHGINPEVGTALADLYGKRTTVNSYHHQSVDVLAPSLRIGARADDGVVEAIELPGADVLGVQWHPEMLDLADPVFRWLIDRAADIRSRRGVRERVPA